MAELFLSYSKSDRSQALELVDELRARGFSVWVDQGGIEGAKNWSAEIVEGINACSTFILLISPHSVASRNVAKEVHLASEKRKNILPVVIEKVALPTNFEYSLAGLQRVYYHDRPAIFRALEMLRGAATLGLAVTEELPRVRTVEDTSIRIAVLPFDDLSPQHDNQWFADGMMDELISTLAHLDRVKVPSRSDVLHYRDHRVKSKDIANELGVRYLIEGAVRKAGERIRINATLIDTRHNEQLWGNQFNGTFEDVFAFQESVSKHITEALKLQLTPRESEAIEARPTQNVEAYELYLKGRHEQYYVTKESYLRALDLYEQAAALDPAFARAHISAASVCCVYYREYSKNPQWLKRAEASLTKAKTISGETSRTLYIRGMLEWLKGDNEAAIATLIRSVEMDPKNYQSFNVLGAIHMENRNYLSAAEAFERVTELVETTTGYFNLLNAIGSAGENERLLQVAQKALPVFVRYLLREPGDQHAALSLAFVLLWAGKKEEAAEAAAHLLDRDDLGGQALHRLGCLFNDLDKPQIFVSLQRKAIGNGYRDIEATRNLLQDITDADCQRELQLAINELEEIIAQERIASIA
jgi:TolB-like protein